MAGTDNKHAGKVHAQTNDNAIADLRSRRYKLLHGIVNLRAVIFLEKAAISVTKYFIPTEIIIDRI
jgi:hypothetical protein